LPARHACKGSLRAQRGSGVQDFGSAAVAVRGAGQLRLSPEDGEPDGHSLPSVAGAHLHFHRSPGRSSHVLRHQRRLRPKPPSRRAPLAPFRMHNPLLRLQRRSRLRQASLPRSFARLQSTSISLLSDSANSASTAAGTTIAAQAACATTVATHATSAAAAVSVARGSDQSPFLLGQRLRQAGDGRGANPPVRRNGRR